MNPIERLKELEAAGIELSRNRHFEFFEDAGNRRALSLSRYIEVLAAEILEGQRSQELVVTLGKDGHGRLELTLRRDDRATSHTAHLSPEEFDHLAAREGVTEALRALGVRWS